MFWDLPENSSVFPVDHSGILFQAKNLAVKKYGIVLIVPSFIGDILPSWVSLLSMEY